MLKNITILLVGVSFLSCSNPLSKDQSNIADIKSQIDSISAKHEIKSADSIIVDSIGFYLLNLDSLDIINEMKYATIDNFLKTKIYPCAKCYLRKDAAEALIKANLLAKEKDLKLLVFDCYRPLGMQKKMFDLVSNKKYVADPIKGSKHNRGVAVDVSLANSKNQALDMGTEFDDFTEEAHYANAAFESDARENRIILRKLMIAAGFVPYDNEWWHFNYKNTNYPLSNFEWQCP